MFFKKKASNRFGKSLDYRVISANLVLFLLILYFVVHSFNGDRGLFAYFRLKNELAQQNEVLNDLVKEREKLEMKAKLLHPKTLDLDMLDEVARRDFSMVAPDEKMVILEEKKQ